MVMSTFWLVAASPSSCGSRRAMLTDAMMGANVVVN